MGTASANRFQRNFMIFVNEDSGFEEGGKPNGHIRLEMRNGKGRLDAVIHNLKEGKGRFRYVLYLIRQSGGGTDYARIGEIRHAAGRAELKCEFDTLSLGSTVRSADEYDIAAVVVEYADRPAGQGDGSANNIICPLTAYKKRPTEWRSGFRKALRAAIYNAVSKDDVEHEQHDQPYGAIFTLSDQKQHTQPEPDLGTRPEQVLHTRPEKVLHTRPEQVLHTRPEQEPEPLPSAGREQEHIPHPFQAGEISKAQSTHFDAASKAQPAYSDEAPEAQPAQADKAPEAQPARADEALKVQPTYPDKVQKAQPTRFDELLETQSAYSDETPEEQPIQHDEMSGAEEAGDDRKHEKTDTADVSRLEKINTDCVYFNGHLCGAPVSNRSDPDPCGSCRINRGETLAKTQLPGNLEGLERELDNNFKVSDPFLSRRSDYKWWRVTNPVNLNNILYQNNIRSPLMFNPAVMLAHYKYKHLIIGIFQHKNGKKYVVCGVPGRHMTDMKPFGEMNKWVQVQGMRPKYGAFGYWLVYIDPDNGRILHPN